MPILCLSFAIFDKTKTRMDNIKQYVAQHRQRFIDELIEILKIPSVSADTAYSQDVLDMADAVADSLRKAGCDAVEICDTDGYPIVYGEKIIDPTLPTVLVYGHYDVQPPDPMDLWESPPFEPVIKATPIHPGPATTKDSFTCTSRHLNT